MLRWSVRVQAAGEHPSYATPHALRTLAEELREVYPWIRAEPGQVVVNVALEGHDADRVSAYVQRRLGDALSAAGLGEWRFGDVDVVAA